MFVGTVYVKRLAIDSINGGVNIIRTSGKYHEQIRPEDRIQWGWGLDEECKMLI